MTKRILSLLTAFLMLMALIPMSVFAKEESAKAAPADETAELLAGYYFESDPASDGWTFVDANNDGFNWMWSSSYTYDDLSTAAYEGSGAIISESYSNDPDYSGSKYAPITPDNWAVSPAVELPEGAPSVTFYATSIGNYGYEHIAVYAGNSADVTEMQCLLEETPVTSNTVGSGPVYQEFTVDLSAFAGETVYVAIRHFNCSDIYLVAVDQVEFWGEAGETPVDPTEPPVDPTEPPVDPTEPPVEEPVAGFYFESQDEFDEWALIDSDGDGYNWEWFSNGFYAYEGSGSATSYSYITGGVSKLALSPDNWLISPALDVPQVDPSVTFWVKNSSSYWPETIAVYVGSSQKIEDMTVVLEAFQPANEYTDYTVDLAQYKGQTVYVAFRHFDSNDKMRVCIDQVELWGTPGEPVELIPIHEVRVNGFETPVEGEVAFDHIALTVPEDANYTTTEDGNWWNDTDDVPILDAAYTFVAGKEYSQGVTVQANEGYYFADDCVFYANGETSMVNPAYTYIDEDDNTIAYVWDNPILCEAAEPELIAIHEVYVNGWGTPVEGVAGIDHMFLETPADAPYFLVYGGWRDETDQQQMWSDEHVFISGHEYSEGCQIWCDEGYYFADDCVFYADGSQEILDLQWCYVDEYENYICYMNSLPVVCEAEAPGILWGDANGDGVVDTADVLLLMRYVMGLVPAEDVHLELCDVNGDGMIDMSDALLIQRKAMDIIDSFPVENP